ncbi:uncharacterized protein BX663DRAFT_552490 [Cokeromyces recurvatus]|uniref:uncharacterized protein n=1 Tax=Cokeromyces recurvatus TaxID=90255 RepID=UPI00221EC688|nr:uncharacterized protein BX663DRAFT_552490 [Cokeromyces recurvatus]KAI7902056.1 hypothetical protein BX663DRAFT_552490 [Cokeromyces recurvatus]
MTIMNVNNNNNNNNQRFFKLGKFIKTYNTKNEDLEKVVEVKTTLLGKLTKRFVKTTKIHSLIKKQDDPADKLCVSSLKSVPERSSLSSSLSVNDWQVHEELKKPIAHRQAELWKEFAVVGTDSIPGPATNGRLPASWRESMILSGKVKILDAMNDKEIKYQELIHEIIYTEQLYVHDLILIHEIFMKESRQFNGLPSSVKILFDNVTEIIQVHLNMLKLDFFSLYSVYFDIFEDATNTIEDCIKSKNEFGLFLARRSLWEECKNLSLTAYLLKPIPRIMAYPLFFKSLLRCVPETDYIHEDIQSCLAKLERMLRYFEEKRADEDDYKKLVDLENRIVGLDGSSPVHIAKYGRKLIYEGYLDTTTPSPKRYQDHQLSEQIQEALVDTTTQSLFKRNNRFPRIIRKKQVYVFLFNDLVVCTYERNKKKKSNMKGRNLRKRLFYGPSADTLFKLAQVAGNLHSFERESGTCSFKHPSLFQPITDFISNVFHTNNNDSKRVRDYKKQRHDSEQVSVLQKKTLGFNCMIETASNNVSTQVSFIADSFETKDTWCGYLENIRVEYLNNAANNVNEYELYIQQKIKFAQESLLSFNDRSTEVFPDSTCTIWINENTKLDNDDCFSNLKNITYDIKLPVEFEGFLKNTFNNRIWTSNISILL